MTDTLFSPGRLGAIEIANRIVMAPLTRNRAFDRVPTALMAEYYRQRAGAGLIVSEGTQISPVGQGYAWTPGIHTPEQVAGWKTVTEAVHAAGGKIVCQIWHVGRISLPTIIEGGLSPVAPSAISAHSMRMAISSSSDARTTSSSTATAATSARNGWRPNCLPIRVWHLPASPAAPTGA